MKKSFVLHMDSLQILDSLTDEQAGQLFKKIKEYHSEIKPKETQITQSVNSVVDLVFVPFKLQFIRDLEKFEKVCDRNRNNGKQGGRPKIKNPKKPKKADSDKDSDSVSDSKKDNNSLPASPTNKLTIEEREKRFYNELSNQVSKYPKETLRAFFNYWTERNKKGDRMRFEDEKFFDIARRLATWRKRENPKDNNLITESNGELPPEIIALYPPGTGVEFIKIKEREKRLSLENRGRQ
jgi:hypothetical protein